MTGPECYREALRLIEHHEYDADEPEIAANDIARAQVLATLALAAATALEPSRSGPTEYRAWTRVAAVTAAGGEDPR
jgi:hypothetical protein